MKLGDSQFADHVEAEAERLRWLGRYLPAPAVVKFMRSPQQAWLVMHAVPGKTAYQLLESEPEQRPAIVDALAAFLRWLHAIPVGECPFLSDHALRLAEARAHIDAGLVEEDDFNEVRARWTAEQVWNCLGEFDAELQRRFLAQYGVATPDQDKLSFHLLLDELL